MRSLIRLTTLATVAVIAGCQSMATANDAPATIVNASELSHAALQLTIDNVLLTHVVIAEGALTESSWLTIDRNSPIGIDKQPTQGRNMEMPIRFQLVMNNGVCILVDQRDDSRYVLQDTECVAE